MTRPPSAPFSLSRRHVARRGRLRVLPRDRDRSRSEWRRSGPVVLILVMPVGTIMRLVGFIGLINFCGRSGAGGVCCGGAKAAAAFYRRAVPAAPCCAAATSLRILLGPDSCWFPERNGSTLLFLGVRSVVWSTLRGSDTPPPRGAIAQSHCSRNCLQPPAPAKLRRTVEQLWPWCRWAVLDVERRAAHADRSRRRHDRIGR